MTPRDRTFVVGLAVLVVLAGVWFGLVSPRRITLNDLRQQNAAARTQRDAAVSQAAAGLAAKHVYAQNLAALAALGKAVPAKDDTASLLYELQDAAGHARVALTSVTPGGAVAGVSTPVPAPAPAPTASPTATGAAPAAAQVVPITLTFQGDYADLQRFLRRVEAFATFHGNAITVHGRLLAISSIVLTTGTGTAHITATITGTTYVASAAPATTAAPAPGAGTTTPPASSAGSATPSTAPAAVLGGAG